jgi:hypothetical protein
MRFLFFAVTTRRRDRVLGLILLVGACLITLGLGASAAVAAPPSKLPAPTEAVVAEVALKIQSGPFVFDPMLYRKEWPLLFVPEDDGDRRGGLGKKTDGLPDPKIQGRLGVGPWKLFEATIPESGCRSPRLSHNGSTVMAICSGLDVGRPSDEHVVVMRKGVVMRYHEPIFRLEGRGDEAEMSPDGRRIAVLAGVGGGRAVHILDLDEMTDTRITGGWAKPMAPSVDADIAAVAFSATVGGKPAAVVVNVDDDKAVAWRGAKAIDVRGLGFRGTRALVIAKPVDLSQAMLLDVSSSELLDLSERKGSVSSARMLPSGATVAFTARVGGVCVVYQAEIGRRLRREIVGSGEFCFDRIFPEENGRFLLWDRVFSGGSAKVTLFDRRKKKIHWELYDSCDRATISADGKVVAAQCGNRKLKSAVYLFMVPAKPTVESEE